MRMARGINKVILIGNLGADPEVRYMPTGGAVANITIATSESWTDKQTNEKKEQTEWHRVVIYQRLAEIAGEYLRKGSKVYIEGRLRTRKWTDQSGQERYVTEIRGDNMQMLDSARANNNQQQYEPSYQPQGSRQNDNSATYSAPQSRPEPVRNNPPAAPASYGHNDLDDDLPF